MHLDINGFQTYFGRENEPGEQMDAVVITDESSVGAPAGFAEGNVHTSSRLIHRKNFIDAMRSRDAGDSHADIIEGHLSSSLCHLANISYRLGRELEFDPETETVTGDDEANEFLSRNYREPFVVPESV
jgi:hypothetical protein